MLHRETEGGREELYVCEACRDAMSQKPGDKLLDAAKRLFNAVTEMQAKMEDEEFEDDDAGDAPDSGDDFEIARDPEGQCPHCGMSP
ncbi:MAG: hypothetical protein FWF96_01455, partial [Kiritimatiellaeota bacterium]|nr:hypothetical protein [Kiritimatiellota bacterium]